MSGARLRLTGKSKFTPARVRLSRDKVDGSDTGPFVNQYRVNKQSIMNAIPEAMINAFLCSNIMMMLVTIATAAIKTVVGDLAKNHGIEEAIVITR